VREKIRTFSCAKSVEQFADSAAETGNGSLSGFAQMRLQFAECLLDRI
jgi:hypothetical protein